MATSTKTIQFSVASASTSLSSAAGQLSAGQTAQFGGGFLSLVVNNMSYAHWSMAFHYDPVRKEIQCLGKDAILGSNGLIGHVIYSEATGSWRLIREWGSGTTGHVYSGHTMDSDGDHYFMQWQDQFFQRYSRASDSWIANSASTSGSWGSAPRALVAAHPNLFGPGQEGISVLVRFPAAVYSYRKSTNAWTGPVSASSFITTTSKEGAAMYSPALDAVVCGAGDGTNDLIRVNSSSSIAEIAPSPVLLGSNSDSATLRSALCTHPISGKPMILENAAASRYWIYESSSNTWVQTGTHPFFNVPSTASSKRWTACTIAAYGVVACLKVTSSADQCRMDLWKPN